MGCQAGISQGPKAIPASHLLFVQQWRTSGLCGCYHTKKLPRTGVFRGLAFIFLYCSYWNFKYICMLCNILQWMERKPDGGSVFRSVRAEEKEARRYNIHKQKAMEIVYARIQAEFEKEENGMSNFCSILTTD